LKKALENKSIKERRQELATMELKLAMVFLAVLYLSTATGMLRCCILLLHSRFCIFLLHSLLVAVSLVVALILVVFSFDAVF